MSRKLFIVRCCLALLALATLGLLLPGMWFLPALVLGPVIYFRENKVVLHPDDPTKVMIGDASQPCCCPCGGKCTGTIPTQIQIVIAGVNNSFVCSNCVAHNATWVLTKSNTDCSGFTNTCLWKFNNSVSPCGSAGLCEQLSISFDGAISSYVTDVFINHLIGPNYQYGQWFRLNHGTTPPACDFFDNTNIPRNAGNTCDGLGTCVATAL